MSGLTPEQRARIERNRQEALAKRARLLQLQQQQQQQQRQQPQPPQPQPPQQGARPANSWSGAPPPAGRQAPAVPVVTVDAHEAALIEQAMMSAQRRLPAQGQAPAEAQAQAQRAPPPGAGMAHAQPAAARPALQSPPAAAGPALTVNLVVEPADGRFKAVCAYHAGAIAAFKTIKSRSYDHPAKSWSFHVRDHDELVKALSAVGGITVNKLPSNVIKTLAGAPDGGAGGGSKDGSLALSDEQVESKLQQLPPDLLSSLMPFQREGVKFAVTHGGRALIGDEMGLGKTLQGIAIAKVFESEWPCLVCVCVCVYKSLSASGLAW